MSEELKLSGIVDHLWDFNNQYHATCNIIVPSSNGTELKSLVRIPVTKDFYDKYAKAVNSEGNKMTISYTIISQ